MSLTDLMAACQAHAMASGLLDRVNGHEPKNAPGKGITAAYWLDDIRPIPARSGLDATTARIALSARLYLPMTTEPQDGIDPALYEAADALMTAYSGDFTLGGLVADVDLLGAHGDPLAVRAGYLDHDGTQYRVLVLTVPLIVNDLWGQQP